MWGAPEDGPGKAREYLQKFDGEGDFSEEAVGEARALGWRVLDGWVLCGHGGGACELGDGGAVCASTRSRAYGTPAAQTF